MIHPVTGALTLQRYGKDDSEVIYATSRAHLNIALMDAAERIPGVTFHFTEKCTGMNFESDELQLHNESTGKDSAVHTDVVIATDGSSSALRSEMQRTDMCRVEQSYLEYGYKELVIPPGPHGQFLLEKNALHIWPRKTYMLIALPNLDGSFTCTFFFPFKGEPSFESLNTKESVREFFTQQFPDAVALMPDLVKDFFSNPTGSMVTVNCSPWYVDGKVLLLGDAAHAIVPFFGQGMNCAFEDCTTLDEILQKETGSGGPETGTWEGVFGEFERLRKVNADAIADLAVENFVEMRDLVAQPKFQFKKKMESALQQRFPNTFIPKYSMVTFHRIPYSVALSRGKLQDKILDELGSSITSPEEIDWKKADELIRTRLTSLYA